MDTWAGAADNRCPALGFSWRGKEWAQQAGVLISSRATVIESRRMAILLASEQSPIGLRENCIVEDVQQPDESGMRARNTRTVERELRAQAELEVVAHVGDSRRGQQVGKSLSGRPCHELRVVELGE